MIYAAALALAAIVIVGMWSRRPPNQPSQYANRIRAERERRVVSITTARGWRGR